MSFTESELLELKKDILCLKDKLAMDKNNQQYGASLSVTPSINSRSNRGSKLDPTSDTVNRNLISSTRCNYRLQSVDVYSDFTKEYESRLVYVNKEVDADLEEKIRRQVEEEFGSDDEEDSKLHDHDTLIDDIDDPYMTRFNDYLSSIRLDQLLRPITKPSDVINIKSVNSIYKEKYLENLSNETIRIIEKEQENVNLLNKMMDVFLLDDPDHIQADNLGLPEYNHHLDLESDEKDKALGKVTNGSNDIEPQKDPFFKPPIYETDPQFDAIDQNEVDETRQLVQIALQRNEEFVRSLSEIRLGFLRADNYREQVYNWCKEMSENEIKKANSNKE